MPFPWDTARLCLNMQNGEVIHFPAGTYNKQVATEHGREQLELMELTYQAHRVFSQMGQPNHKPDKTALEFLKIAREVEKTRQHG